MRAMTAVGWVYRMEVKPMSTTTTDDHEELVAEYFTAWTDQESTDFPDILAEDFSGTLSDPTGSEIQWDAERLRDTWAESFQTREDPQVEIHTIVADEDRVMSHITYSYTHVEEEYGVSPTGNRIEVEEYFTFHIQNGEIVAMHNLINHVKRLKQLGIEIPVDS